MSRPVIPIASLRSPSRHKAGGNALGHCHRNPPKWDDRDAVCTWCVSVATLRHALGADRG